MQHLKDEINALQRDRNFSITWSVHEATFLAQPFLRESALTNRGLANRALADVPLLLIDSDTGRSAMDYNELQKHQEFWTVEGVIYDSAEALLREVASPASLRTVIGSLQSSSLDLPRGLILCRDPVGAKFQMSALANREPIEMKLNRLQRRLDVRWGFATTPPNWIKVVPDTVKRERAFQRVVESARYRKGSAMYDAHVAKSAIPIIGLDDEIAVRTNDELWFFTGSHIAIILIKLAEAFAKPRSSRNTRALLDLTELIDNAIRGMAVQRPIINLYQDFEAELDGFIPRKELVAAVEKTSLRLFDAHAWTRKDSDEMYDF